MQGFQNEKTRKMNIELSKTNFELVQQYAGLHIGKITYVLNYIIKMMANIPEEVRKKLLIFCEDRIEEMKQIPFIDETEVKQRIDAYQCLCHFFANETSKKDTMLSNDVEKFKTTVSFTPSNIKAATHEAKKIGTTFARYTNYLISLALDIPPRVQGELSVLHRLLVLMSKIVCIGCTGPEKCRIVIKNWLFFGRRDHHITARKRPH